MNQFLDSKFTTILLALLCLWTFALAAGSHIRHAATEQELVTLQDRITKYTQENSRLSRELKRMKEPAWLTLLARTRLNYKRPDETVVFVYKSEKSDIMQPHSVPDEQPNWRKWLAWLQGK